MHEICLLRYFSRLVIPAHHKTRRVYKTTDQVTMMTVVNRASRDEDPPTDIPAGTDMARNDTGHGEQTKFFGRDIH